MGNLPSNSQYTVAVLIAITGNTNGPAPQNRKDSDDSGAAALPTVIVGNHVRPEHHRKREKGGDKEQHGHRERQSLRSQPQAQEDEVYRQEANEGEHEAPRAHVKRASRSLSPSAMMKATQTTAKAS